MAETFDPTDPKELAADELLCEVAHILAAGVLRLRQRSTLPALPEASDSDPNGLAECR